MGASSICNMRVDCVQLHVTINSLPFFHWKMEPIFPSLDSGFAQRFILTNKISRQNRKGSAASVTAIGNAPSLNPNTGVVRKSKHHMHRLMWRTDLRACRPPGVLAGSQDQLPASDEDILECSAIPILQLTSHKANDCQRNQQKYET